MVDIFEGLEKTGIYAIALYVGSVILVPKKSLAKISLPIISNSFKNNNLQHIGKIYKQSATNQFLLGFLIYIGIIANLDNLYSLLPEEFKSGSIVILIIGLANLFDMINGANGQIVITSKYYRFDFYSSMILVVTSAVLNYLLIPKFGLTGAAIATASAIFIYNLVKTIFVWVKLEIQPFSWRLLSIIGIGLIVLYASYYLPFTFNLFFDILIRSALITLVYGLCIWKLNLSEEINLIINDFFQKVSSISK
jgi:O-antigen/teichoic acid export membrane protein